MSIFSCFATQSAPDLHRFRIEICEKDNDDVVVYDNQVVCSDGAKDADPCTEIGGGSIVVHEGKK
ncbi:MAG: hypothetical protein IMY85_11225 [Chloroflexi bacterium]|nr:hypothetical protein [Chloroflexota bacterium]